MRRRLDWGAELLYWQIKLLGVVIVAACVLLPVWEEYLAARERVAAASMQLAELDQHITIRDKQIEHLQTDPAYAARLARREFRMQPPDTKYIALPSPPSVESAVSVPPHPDLNLDYLRPQKRFPALELLLNDQTQPVVLLCGGLLLGAALVLILPGLPQVPRPGRVVRRAADTLESAG